MGTIVTAYDASPEAATAVRWAARQASLRNDKLTVVHCSIWPAFTHDLGPVPGIADSGLRHAAEAVLAEGADIAREESPDVPVTTVLKYGWAAGLLRDVAGGSDAAMLVVGSRGIGGFMGLLVGSVSLELAATADCPVAVIREAAHPDGPVVVGIDTALPHWEPIVRQACTLATLTGASLEIVHVHAKHGGRRHLTPPMPHRPEEVLDDVERTVRRWSPVIDVRTHTLTGTSTSGTLLDAARDASAIVVGAHGTGVVRGSMGSTAHAVLHHALCPVVVVRPAGES
ncbi:universal stress protein [Paenarthrobacter sp. NPDC092416]|uniref:universal stress protein n=1 Tax=Paenarthrobacter sp. NPDC092416 TaxID=3364386 RepID=UPI00380A1D3D